MQRNAAIRRRGSHVLSQRQLRLVRQLQSAHRSLSDWSQRIRVSAIQAPSVSGGAVSPDAVLLAIVELAKQQIDQRLSELATHRLTIIPARVSTRPQEYVKRRSTLDVCLDACRACGRALGTAFREAQAGADSASAKILYATLRDLERQLWVLNPRQAT